MRRLALALLLSCTPAYAEAPKPKPAAPRKVDRTKAMELRALQAALAHPPTPL